MDPVTPTAGQYLDVPAGRLHYVDVGAGPPVVFVHGNPASSAEFGPAIGALRDHHRCIAVDHIGFGASDKPSAFDYLPSSHAANLAQTLDSLDLTDVTMVVGDWGGPIGLSWVLANPDRVRRVVIANTWFWPVNRSWYYQGFSRFMGGPIGRLLVTRFNFFARQVVKQAWGKRTELTPELHAQFTDVHKDPAERKGMWVFPREIIGSTDWLSGLWDKRRALDAIDLRLVWGMTDIAFRPDVLDRWQSEFPHATAEKLDDVGHFVALEATDRIVAAVDA